MAGNRSRKGMRPGWERPRVNGKFAPLPEKPAKPYPVRQTTVLRQLRNMAIQTAKRLEEMLKREDAARKKKRDAVAGAADARPAEIEQPDPVDNKTEDDLPTQAEYERLLGKNGGVIDGLNALGQLTIRLIDKEREGCDPRQEPPWRDAFPAEGELDRRIHAELSRLAARRGSAGGVDGGAGHAGGEGEIPD